MEYQQLERETERIAGVELRDKIKSATVRLLEGKERRKLTSDKVRAVQRERLDRIESAVAQTESPPHILIEINITQESVKCFFCVSSEQPNLLLH